MKQSDWQAVHEYPSDAQVVQYMNWEPNTEEETKGFIMRALPSQNEKPRRGYTLAIVLRAEDSLIGGCSIHVSNSESKEGWIDYCLNRDFWGKGYAIETASALVDFGFDEVALHRIFALCDPANISSAHVLEKAGMKLEGHIREHI